MDLNKIPLMNAIASRLSWLSQKQEVISQNVANANTPGYLARTVDEPRFSDILNSSTQRPVKTTQNQTMRKTNSKHMSLGSSPSGNKPNIVVDKNASSSSTNGNTVVLEEQVMEMAKTQLEYSTTINLYRRHMGLIKSALGTRSR